MRPWTALVVVVLLVSVGVARGEGAPLDSPSFARGTWSLELFGSYGDPIRYSDEEVYSAGVGLGYYLFDNVSVGLRASGLFIDQLDPFDDPTGGTVDLLARWHFLRFERFTLFVDGGGGRMWTDAATPPGGTTYNWTGRGGLGATYELRHGLHLLGGARYFHYSNGDEHDRVKNPGHDGVEGYVGVMWTF